MRAPAVTFREPPEPAVSRRALAGYLAMVLGLFMAVLDIQIVASSLREIQAALSASLDEISWVQTSYLIAEVIMIPLSGWLARLLSTRWLFVASAGGFTLMSLASATAWSIGSMIVFRALQGFFGGAMIPTVFASTFRIFPEGRQAGATVMAGLVATMAPTLGPTLGGWITQSFSWHWLFLINLVPGAIVCLAVALLVDIDRPRPELLRRIDLLGIVSTAIFLGSLEYVLEEGPGKDWFDSRLILALTAVTAVSALLFLWRELRCAHPVVDLWAFRDRNFAIGCLFSFVIGVGLYGSVYLLPLFLSSVRGYNSLQIGLIMMVTGAFQFLSGPIAGLLEKRIDRRLMLMLGFGMFGLALWLNAFMTAEAGFAELFLPQAVRGMAIMLCFLPITTIALGRLPTEELNNASGLFNLTRNLGGAIGLASIDTVFDARYDLHYERLAEAVSAARAGVVDRLADLTAHLQTMLPDAARAHAAALSLLRGSARREALVMTYNDLFMLVAAVFFLSLLLTPLLRKVDHGTAAERERDRPGASRCRAASAPPGGSHRLQPPVSTARHSEGAIDPAMILVEPSGVEPPTS